MKAQISAAADCCAAFLKGGFSLTRYEKIAQMKPEQKNHWIDIPELTFWGERIFAEIAVAEELSKAANGAYDALIEQAVDCLYNAFCKEHALADSVCEKAEQYLLPLSPKAKEYTVHHVAHAHIDMDWMWGLHETVDIILNTFRTMLDLMDEYPEFTFSQSQCAVYRLAEFYDPTLFARLKKRVEEGRFEFAGSTFVELDKNMPNLESMARHILYTKQFLKERFGIPYEDINQDFHPDTFGHSASVPEIMAAGGIRYFYHCRGLDGEQFYRWRSPSGAEVLALNEPMWYNDLIRAMYLPLVPQFCNKYGIHDMMKIYGVGDHGGGPTRKDIEMILAMREWPLAPRMIFSTYGTYFAAIEPYRENFPVITGELGPTFTGCYTSQSKIKMANRIAEDRLYMAEALAAFAVSHTGMRDFNTQFRAAWEKVLFNQFHDILPGSNVPESRDHAMGAFEEAMGSVMAGAGASLRAFAKEIDTSMFETPDVPLSSRSEGGGVGLNTDETNRFRLPGTERGRGKTRLLHFFNPTRFDREGVFDATVWDWPGDPDLMRAYDLNGALLACTAIPSKTTWLDWNHTRTDILVKAKVPAFGYTTVRITEGEKNNFCFAALPPDPRVTYYTPLVMENELVRVTFDEADLSVRSYFDKRTGRDLLGGKGARFILNRERTLKGGSAWVEGIHKTPCDLHKHAEVALKEDNLNAPLRKTLSYEIKYGKSKLEVTAQLTDDSPVLEFSVKCDWMELASPDEVPVLSFAASLSYHVPVYRSDIQIGLLDRQPEAMHDSCSRNFYYAPDAKGENGLLLLTDSKYGYRGYDDTLQVTLLRSSSNPDPYPELGIRRFRIGLSCEKNDPLTLKAAGDAFINRDLPYASNTAHTGTLPLSARFFSMEGDAVVTAIKVSETKNGTIIRLASVHTDRETDISISVPHIEHAVFVDLAEQPLGNCAVANETVSLTLKAGQTVSLLLS